MEFIISCIEIFTVNIYYNILFDIGYKKNICKYILLSFILALGLHSLGWVNYSLVKIILFILQGIIIGHMYKKEKIMAIIEIGIASVIVIFSEVFVGLVFITKLGKSINIINILIILIIMFGIMAFILNYVVKKVHLKLENIIERYTIIWVFIFNIIIFFEFVLISTENKEFFRVKYINYLLLLIVAIIINILSYSKIFKELEEKRKLERNREYKLLIDELLEKVAENEHEYKNHLNTLRAMVGIGMDNDLKSSVDEYMDSIIKTDVYSKIAYIENNVIKAILYNKLNICLDKGIKFQHKILADFYRHPIENTELSIILNNLLNNAIEAVELLPEKSIYIKIFESKKYEIIVRNTISTETEKKLERIFNKGFTTKGGVRGFGLSNTKKIVYKYNGTIYLLTDEKYLTIRIII